MCARDFFKPCPGRRNAVFSGEYPNGGAGRVRPAFRSWWPMIKRRVGGGRRHTSSAWLSTGFLDGPQSVHRRDYFAGLRRKGLDSNGGEERIDLHRRRPALSGEVHPPPSPRKAPDRRTDRPCTGRAASPLFLRGRGSNPPGGDGVAGGRRRFWSRPAWQTGSDRLKRPPARARHWRVNSSDQRTAAANTGGRPAREIPTPSAACPASAQLPVW